LVEDDTGEIMATSKPKVVTVRVAIDSGAVRNTVSPDELPDGVEPSGVPNGPDYVGANNSVIKRYGSCRTTLEGVHGVVGCDWETADVTRPLHSVSQVTGPADAPARHNVLFSNRVGVVVPPGVVEEILKRVRPIVQYNREGNLYIAEMKMSSFPRPGVSQ